MSTVETVVWFCPDCPRAFTVDFVYVRAPSTDGHPHVAVMPSMADYRTIVEHITQAGEEHLRARSGPPPSVAPPWSEAYLWGSTP